METKPKILYLLKILTERTDEFHPLTTNQLIAILDKEYGISVHRTTIPKDMAVLKEFGIDVITIHSTQCKYFIGNRRFELPELKLLIDAVESSKFITTKKTEELVAKIKTLTSENNAKKIKRNNYVSKAVKPDNEQIYYIVDAINDAINNNKKISFQYYDYTRFKDKILRHDGEVYVLSPYHLVWHNDYYYVVGYSEKRKDVICFRVDRIANVPVILEDDRMPMPSEFHLNEFVKTAFNMYGGETVLVDLQCNNKLMKTMIDRFGEDAKTYAYDMESFHIITEVEVSQTFFGWVFGFNGDVRILGPESVKEEYRKMIKTAWNQV